MKFDAVCADSTGKTIGAVELHIFNGFSVSDGNGGSREFTENFLVAVFCRPVIELVVFLPFKMNGQLGIFTVS